MSSKEILVAVKEHIGIITLNRPDHMNTFTVPFAHQLNQSLEQLDEDDNVNVIVIDAAGRHFSVGIALDEFKDKDHKEYREMIRLMDLHNHTIARMKKPVIASVQGYALANGAGLAYAADMTVAAESSKFGTTAINVGLICLGPAIPLSHLVGRKKMLEMVLTGDMFSARQALELGMINRIAADDELQEATLDLARQLAQKSPLALQIGKQGVYAMADLSHGKAVDYLGEMFAALCSTEDASEGLAAFEEKRKPEWKLR